MMFSIRRDVKIHFIGIGGIGMSGIAEVLLSLGYKVSGSDIADSANVKKLRKLGAEVFIGHDQNNIKDSTVVVFSSAVKDDNPEMIKAKANNLPIMQRAEMLAELMRLKHGLAIAGTHGKTTTTSILATILQESDFDPTYIIGGIVKNLDGHAKVGKGDFLLAEADESDGSFLLLDPIMSVVTNIDLDHMDYYETEEKLERAFLRFMNKVPFYGLVALNAHDDRLMELKKKLKKPSATFGIGEIEADFVAKEISYKGKETSFDLYYNGKKVERVSIKLPGHHNILNTLGAIVLAYNMGLSFSNIVKAITKFDCVGRRFNFIYEKDKFEVIDDYAHHPTEIAATIKAIKETRPDKKAVVIFEPHRYTRTRDCWNQFLHCFNEADELYISCIYPASEKPIDGISGRRLSEDINKLHPNFANFFPDIKTIGNVIEGVDKDATVLTLGAGSIGRLVREWAKDK